MVDGPNLRKAVTSSSSFQFTLLLCLYSYSVAKEACPVAGYTYSAATETDYAKASTFGTAAIGLSSGGEGYLGGVFSATTSKIYGIPCNAFSVLVIDPATSTTSAINITGDINLAQGAKWSGGVFSPSNGVIYGIPGVFVVLAANLFCLFLWLCTIFSCLFDMLQIQN